MILDTSAIIAILRAEADAPELARAVELARVARLSSATYLEASIVIDRMREPIASRRLDDFMGEAKVQIEPFTLEQAHIARAAYRDFGRGSGHPARLNYGDCFAYALAKVMGEPLLYKGGDFAHTDVQSAL